MMDGRAKRRRHERGAFEMADVRRRFVGAPVSGATAIVAIAATLAYWSDDAREAMATWVAGESSEVWAGRVWPLVTSALLHGDIIHLVFNVYWVWVLYSEMERLTTPARAALFGLGAAAFSAAAELIATDHMGIGLSGVGYAVFGFGWARSSRDPRYARLIPQETLNLWLGWGVLCVVLTMSGTWNVANYAHGGGLFFGWFAAHATARGKFRRLAAAAIALPSAAFVLLAVVGPPWSMTWHASRAERAMDDGRWTDAIPLIDRAAALGAYDEWVVWNRYRCVYETGDMDAAGAYFETIRRDHPKIADEIIERSSSPGPR